jgi:hypothetical protein
MRWNSIAMEIFLLVAFFAIVVPTVGTETGES